MTKRFYISQQKYYNKNILLFSCLHATLILTSQDVTWQKIQDSTLLLDFFSAKVSFATNFSPNVYAVPIENRAFKG